MGSYGFDVEDRAPLAPRTMSFYGRQRTLANLERRMLRIREDGTGQLLAAAPLPAVCPAGVEDGVRPDLTLTPGDLPAAWAHMSRLAHKGSSPPRHCSSAHTMAPDRTPVTPGRPSRPQDRREELPRPRQQFAADDRLAAHLAGGGAGDQDLVDGRLDDRPRVEALEAELLRFAQFHRGEPDVRALEHDLADAAGAGQHAQAG